MNSIYLGPVCRSYVNVISCNKRQFAIAAGTKLLLLLLLLFILK